MSLRRFLLLAALALTLAPFDALRAQDVRIRGDDRSRAAQLAREVLARGNYLRIDRDTILPATFRIDRDLVVYDAEVRLEGTVEGSVVVVGGHLFIRPRARVTGPIAVIGGDVYESALATTGEILYPEPGSRVALEGDTAAADTSAALEATLTAPRPARLLTFLPRPYPSYDRVNGFSAGLGARLLPARTDSGPRVDAWVSYRTENPEKWGGGARVDLPLGTQSLRLVGEGSRATRTNDAWIRGDLSNSIAVLGTGRDFRNYYDADRVSVMLTRPVGKPLVTGESWLSPRVGVQWEQARSLETADDLWALFESDADDGIERPNPPVLEGTLVSAIAGAGLVWRGRVSGVDADLQVEYAVPGSSDAEFTQLVGQLRYQALAFRTHQVRVYLRGTAPLGGEGAPPQRFGILGGAGTLPTLNIGHFRGDHLAFVDASYGIPLPFVEVPYLGIPVFELVYATGAAWVGGDVPEWVQNPGVGLAFPLFSVRVQVDPAVRPLEPKFSFAVSILRR